MNDDQEEINHDINKLVELTHEIMGDYADMDIPGTKGSEIDDYICNSYY